MAHGYGLGRLAGANFQHHDGFVLLVCVSASGMKFMRVAKPLHIQTNRRDLWLTGGKANQIVKTEHCAIPDRNG